MDINSSDLIIRFDEGNNKVLLLIPSSPGKSNALKLFFEIPVPEIVSVADFSGEIGIAVASFLHARHGERFLADDGEPDEPDEEGSESDPFEDARLLIDRIGDGSSLEEIMGVELLLKEASKSGNKEAERYLKKTWPGLKAIFIKRIHRK